MVMLIWIIIVMTDKVTSDDNYDDEDDNCDDEDDNYIDNV